MHKMKAIIRNYNGSPSMLIRVDEDGQLDGAISIGTVEQLKTYAKDHNILVIKDTGQW